MTSSPPRRHARRPAGGAPVKAHGQATPGRRPRRAGSHSQERTWREKPICRYADHRDAAVRYEGSRTTLAGASQRRRARARQRSGNHVLRLRSQARDLCRHHRGRGACRASPRSRRARLFREYRPHLPLAVRACSSTTCRPRATPAARSPRAASSRAPLRQHGLRLRRPGPRRTPTSSPTPPATRRMGLYAMWALRDEVARVGAPELLPADVTHQRLRLEDLLGFRRNPITDTPLFTRVRRQARSTGIPRRPRRSCGSPPAPRAWASPARIGLAFGARDYYGARRPARAHRRGRGRADARDASPRRWPRPAPASLDNVVLHLDWNQASIDSNRVCRDGDAARRLRPVGPDGAVLPPRLERDLRPRRQRLPAGPRRAAARRSRSTNGQPTAIVYRTVKGWQYGIEGARPTAPATSSAPTASTRPWPRSWATRTADLPRCRRRRTTRAARPEGAARSWRTASGRRSA